MLYKELMNKLEKEKKRIERKKQLKNIALIGVGAGIGAIAAALTTPKKR